MIKGVNLGNWLVLEKWMSPGLFAGTEAEDETQLSCDLADVAKRERLTAHRDSYITERDFAYLAHHGIDRTRPRLHLTSMARPGRCLPAAAQKPRNAPGRHLPRAQTMAEMAYGDARSAATEQVRLSLRSRRHAQITRI